MGTQEERYIAGRQPASPQGGRPSVPTARVPGGQRTPGLAFGLRTHALETGDGRLAAAAFRPYSIHTEFVDARGLSLLVLHDFENRKLSPQPVVTTRSRPGLRQCCHYPRTASHFRLQARRPRRLCYRRAKAIAKGNSRCYSWVPVPLIPLNWPGYVIVRVTLAAAGGR